MRQVAGRAEQDDDVRIGHASRGAGPRAAGSCPVRAGGRLRLPSRASRSCADRQAAGRRRRRPSGRALGTLTASPSAGSRSRQLDFTSWPPNSFRSAASTFAPYESSWRERKRVCSDERDHGRRHVAVDRLLDGPAALAGVGDPALELAEVLAALPERVRRELEQPRADDRAVVPQVGDRGEVERVLARVHDLEALGVGLHQPVLDAVVDHLHVVAGAGRAGVEVAVDRRERAEDRLERLDRLAVAADHQAEAVREPPDAAGHAGVDVVDAVLRELGVAPDVVVEVRVAAVDDRVAGLEVLEQLGDLGLGRVAGGDHDPDARAASSSFATSSATLLRRDEVVPGRLLLVGELDGLLDGAVVGHDAGARRGRAGGPCSPPIRPSPMKPSCMCVLLGQRGLHRPGRGSRGRRPGPRRGGPARPADHAPAAPRGRRAPARR